MAWLDGGWTDRLCQANCPLCRYEQCHFKDRKPAIECFMQGQNRQAVVEKYEQPLTTRAKTVAVSPSLSAIAQESELAWFQTTVETP
jgi:hypothetical protein